MKSLKQSIAASLDCTDLELLPFLPYILQDFHELGTPPRIIVDVVRKNVKNYPKLRILDLGCGKGAVSLELARSLGCQCLGIDGLKEFIEEAEKLAKKYEVTELCTFEVNDIRHRVSTLVNYDAAVLGSIGLVFGDYFSTLITVSRCVKDDGIVVLADAYTENSSSFSPSLMLSKQELLRQAKTADMKLIDEVITENQQEIEQFYDEELCFIVQRCRELMEKHSEKAFLFENYIRKQKEEYAFLKKSRCYLFGNGF